MKGNLYQWWVILNPADDDPDGWSEVICLGSVVAEDVGLLTAVDLAPLEMIPESIADRVELVTALVRGEAEGVKPGLETDGVAARVGSRYSERPEVFHR